MLKLVVITIMVVTAYAYSAPINRFLGGHSHKDGETVGAAYHNPETDAYGCHFGHCH